MPNTARLNLHTPASTDPADGPTALQNLANQLDNLVPGGSGTLAARPTSTVGTPGIVDRLYWANDTGLLYRDTGTGWVTIGPYTSLVAQGIFVAPASTGLQTVTGIGFQPKKVSFQWLDISYAISNRAIMGRGGMTAASQFAAFSHAISAGQASSTMATDRCILSSDADGTLRFSAAYNAFLPDGFRVNWLDVFATHDLNVMWEAWG